MKLADLQNQFAAEAFLPANLAMAPAECGMIVGSVCRSPTADERMAADLVIETGVKVLAELKPHSTSKHRWRALVKDRLAVQDQGDGKQLVCGFGLFIGALLTWLIGKGISYLWELWLSSRLTPALVCRMVAA